LAENAARHARSKVRIAAKVQSGVARIQLVDDGPGAPEAVLQDLAKRGFRADERAGGQGLGLAIVADIIEAAGGQLRFANGGPGLVVSLELPSA
jgi:signal transduction histidine kinase